MIELSRHIECLMLRHDCVIVPGLGGFVTQNVPARYVSDEKLFLPPYRSVGFNAQLTLNDGLLVQSYMQAYDTDYAETVKLVDDAVMQLKQELQEKGEYELSGIGTLTLGIGGKYNFTPCEAGVLSPELYGLDAVNVVNIKHTIQEQKQEESKQRKRKVRLRSSEKSYTITLNRELVNYVAAAVVAVFFYFLWATPVSNTSNGGSQTASVLYEQLFNSSTQQAAYNGNAKLVNPVDSVPINLMGETSAKGVEVELQDADIKANEVDKNASSQVLPTNNDVAKQTEKVATEVLNKAETTEKGSYTLVLASAITEENAKVMSNKLGAQGLRKVHPYKRGHMVRVVCGQYANKQQAQQALTKLQQNNQFAEAWVMEIK